MELKFTQVLLVFIQASNFEGCLRIKNITYFLNVIKLPYLRVSQISPKSTILHDCTRTCKIVNNS